MRWWKSERVKEEEEDICKHPTSKSYYSSSSKSYWCGECGNEL